jgi:lipopolysaccharide/colanic/teichoic acid biosynthesis glycosyltransferase
MFAGQRHAAARRSAASEHQRCSRNNQRCTMHAVSMNSFSVQQHVFSERLIFEKVLCSILALLTLNCSACLASSLLVYIRTNSMGGLLWGQNRPASSPLSFLKQEKAFLF